MLDPAACDGFGFCAELLPDAISRDEWGFPILRGEITGPELAAARLAVRSCPRRALRIERSAGQTSAEVGQSSGPPPRRG